MIEINNATNSKVNINLIKKVTEDFLIEHKSEKKEISVGIIDDEKMHEINKQYRHKDKTTDVLSFEGEDEDLGEILISIVQIERQAKKYGKSKNEELIFILVHGLFHLLGYTDETEEDRINMIDLANKFIKKGKYKYD